MHRAFHCNIIYIYSMIRCFMLICIYIYIYENVHICFCSVFRGIEVADTGARE